MADVLEMAASLSHEDHLHGALPETVLKLDEEFSFPVVSGLARSNQMVVSDQFEIDRQAAELVISCNEDELVQPTLTTPGLSKLSTPSLLLPVMQGFDPAGMFRQRRKNKKVRQLSVPGLTLTTSLGAGGGRGSARGFGMGQHGGGRGAGGTGLLGNKSGRRHSSKIVFGAPSAGIPLSGRASFRTSFGTSSTSDKQIIFRSTEETGTAGATRRINAEASHNNAPPQTGHHGDRNDPKKMKTSLKSPTKGADKNGDHAKRGSARRSRSSDYSLPRETSTGLEGSLLTIIGELGELDLETRYAEYFETSALPLTADSPESPNTRQTAERLTLIETWPKKSSTGPRKGNKSGGSLSSAGVLVVTPGEKTGAPAEQSTTLGGSSREETLDQKLPELPFLRRDRSSPKAGSPKTGSHSPKDRTTPKRSPAWSPAGAAVFRTPDGSIAASPAARTPVRIVTGERGTSRKRSHSPERRAGADSPASSPKHEGALPSSGGEKEGGEKSVAAEEEVKVADEGAAGVLVGEKNPSETSPVSGTPGQGRESSGSPASRPRRQRSPERFRIASPGESEFDDLASLPSQLGFDGFYPANVIPAAIDAAVGGVDCSFLPGLGATLSRPHTPGLLAPETAQLWLNNAVKAAEHAKHQELSDDSPLRRFASKDLLDEDVDSSLGISSKTPSMRSCPVDSKLSVQGVEADHHVAEDGGTGRLSPVPPLDMSSLRSSPVGSPKMNVGGSAGEVVAEDHPDRALTENEVVDGPHEERPHPLGGLLDPTLLPRITQKIDAEDAPIKSQGRDSDSIKPAARPEEEEEEDQPNERPEDEHHDRTVDPRDADEEETSPAVLFADAVTELISTTEAGKKMISLDASDETPGEWKTVPSSEGDIMLRQDGIHAQFEADMLASSQNPNPADPVTSLKQQFLPGGGLRTVFFRH